MAKFHLVALGGTFDILHKGHLALLQKGFSVSSKVIIGLTSDELATKKGKNLLHSYLERYHTLESLIKKNFPNSQFEISKLDNDFGPAVLEKEIEALIVSEETIGQGHILNKLRHEKQLLPVEIVSVPMVLAADGKRISTSRIKDSEIDAEGNLR
ncbi:MAG: pantetheine-phosphate adenylyltransferase [Thaumarchaeota archaeon]|nr:pantetheine-phosphate adenylyltransferase [Nitrososphaerota archaeon]